MNAPTAAPLVNLTIDGKAIAVSKGTTIYNAAKQMGIEIPVFCYLDRMPPFGSCRMCLVEVEKMGKLQTSCTLEVAEGMVVKTQTPMAVSGRKEIIEFLLLNHPLDCPICDRGGECPLQENALKYGPGMSRFFEEKRHFQKAKPLGSVLMLDRERCIVCARCTRFCDILSGDHALEFIQRGYKTEVGTPNGGPAESKFIGNTIMICPVGALTSQVYRFRARPWDNEPTESTCTLCPVGCSMFLDSRDGQIMRTRSKENRDVNDIWLCDKGWFGYEFCSHSDRLTHPLVRRNGTLESASWEEALSLVAAKITAAKSQNKIAGFGGNPLTFEENYFFQKLMRQGAATHHVDHRIGMPLFTLEEEGMGPGMEMPIAGCEELSYAIFFGLDLTEEFPVLWLRLRQAIHKGAKIYFVGHYAPEIASYLSKTIIHPPGQEIEMVKNTFSQLSTLIDQGGKGAIFVGRQYLSSPNRKLILAEILQASKKDSNLTLNIMEGNGNSLGARLAGMRPDVGPFEEKLPEQGLNALQVLESAAENGWDLLYVVGTNPAMLYPAKLWAEARQKCGFMVVQDLFLTETAQQADVVLPALSFVEKGGTFINIEGRLQTLLPGKEALENVYSDADIFMKIGEKLNLDMKSSEFFDKLNSKELKQKKNENLETTPSHSFQLDNRYPLKATFVQFLFDQGVRMLHDPHLIDLAKEPFVRIHPEEGIKRELQDGMPALIHSSYNTITANIQFDKTVALNTCVIPLGFDRKIAAHELGLNLLNGLSVEVSKLL